jgi:hypothetical protein
MRPNNTALLAELHLARQKSNAIDLGQKVLFENRARLLC